jgi:hypothetical protein
MKVNLENVVDEMDVMSDEATAYLNRKTGELFTLNFEEMREVEEEEEEEEKEDRELPAWQRESLRKAREILGSEDWLALPSKFEIHEYAIMEEFCRSVDDDNLSEELLKAIRGSGAFRYFKDTIHRHGIQDEWYSYRKTAFEKIAIEWLEAHGIEYERGSKNFARNQ